LTVESVKSVKELVEEMGEDQIGGIYKYRHANTGKQLYAIFPKNQFIDIYHSPFCTEIECIFYNGKWEQELKEE